MNPILTLIQSGESETLEFKSPGSPIPAVAEAVCAMLNQQGGTVIWGVNAKEEPVGIPNAEARAAELNAYLMRQLAPRPLLSVTVEKLPKANLVVVEIPRGADKPYSLARKIWVRVGARTMRAAEEETARMVEKSAVRFSRWERNIAPGFDLGNCEDTELANARKEIEKVGRFGIAVPNDHEELLRRLYLFNNGQLTNAAMVLFAKDPLAWSPNLALRIIFYGTGKQGNALREQTLQGPAVSVLGQAISVIQQQTGFTGQFKPGKLQREDRPAYAFFALREGLVNAMAHRDYEAPSGQLRVEIFPEHLIIQNPGKLPDGWTERDILTKQESHPHNPDIASVFHLRGLMERLGIGGRKLRDECVALKAKPPQWKAAAGTVTLTLFRAPMRGDMESLPPRQAEFLQRLQKGQSFKAAEYADAVGVSLRQARRDLGELTDAGLLARRGEGPATVYQSTGGSHGN